MCISVSVHNIVKCLKCTGNLFLPQLLICSKSPPYHKALFVTYPSLWLFSLESVFERVPDLLLLLGSWLCPRLKFARSENSIERHTYKVHSGRHDEDNFPTLACLIRKEIYSN